MINSITKEPKSPFAMILLTIILAKATGLYEIWYDDIEEFEIWYDLEKLMPASIKSLMEMNMK